MKHILITSLFLLLFCTGCQKWKKNLAFSEEGKDSPEYTVGFNPNTSPLDKK